MMMNNDNHTPAMLVAKEIRTRDAARAQSQQHQGIASQIRRDGDGRRQRERRACARLIISRSDNGCGWFGHGGILLS